MKIRSLAFLFVPLLLLGCQTFGEILIPPEQFAKLPAETEHSTDTEIYATIKTRPGVTVSFIILKPKGNLPIVLFFRGGDWSFGFADDIETAFSGIGLGAVDVNPPSGFSDVPYRFRETQEHVRDVEAIIRFIRKRYPKNQIWISGHSTGSVSTANIVTNTKEKVDGAVFYSSISTDVIIAPVLSYAIGDLKIPVLAVHHKYDACKNTEPSVAEDIARAARNAPVSEALLVEGGRRVGDPCQLGHHHGFAGIRVEVFKKVGDWILKNSK